MATRREICKWCGTYLMVPLEAPDVKCPVCHTINCVRRKIKSYVGWYGNDNDYNNLQPHAAVAPQVHNNSSNIYQQQQEVAAVSSPPPMHGNSYYHLPGNSYYHLPIQIYMQGPRPVRPPQVPARKKAVLCGVTYKGHPQRLDASLNNVRSVQQLLLNTLGFPTASILVLTEEESDPSRIPTKINIQRALRWLIQGCQSGDSLVFYYSGHGSRVQDTDGDEIDGYDESLCPVDYKSAGKILDDEINATIVAPLPRGAKLHSVIDTCFSGTLLDLPYLCRMNQMGYYVWEDHRISHTAAYKDTSGGIAVCISACDDHQNSGDTTAFTGTAIGALTYSFIQAVKNEPKLTYGRLLGAMRNKVHKAQEGLGLNAPFASSTSQEPQLSSSMKFDIYSKPFVL